MEFFDVIKKRRSVRAYTGEPVSRSDIMKILDAGNFAPSGRNLQQWEFLVVSGERVKQLGASYGRIAEGYTRDWEPEARDNFIAYASSYGGAPVILAVLAEASDHPATRKMHLESGSAAMENIVLAAAALNLGTCWMLGPLQDEAAVRQILQVSDEWEIVAISPLGHPVAWPEAPARLDPDLKRKVRWLD